MSVTFALLIATFAASSPGRWRADVELSAGVYRPYWLETSPLAGAALELTFHPVRHFRFGLSGAAHVGDDLYVALAVLDAVLPLSWAELFAGTSFGYAASNELVYEADCIGARDWRSCAAMRGAAAARARAGIDVTALAPFVVGFTVSYTALVPGDARDLTHVVLFGLRVGVALGAPPARQW